MTNWTDEHPGNGDLSGINAAIKLLGEQAEKAQETALSLTQIGGAMQEIWTSDNASKRSEQQISEASTALLAMHHPFAGPRDALKTYASTVEEIKRQSDAVHLELDPARVSLQAYLSKTRVSVPQEEQDQCIADQATIARCEKQLKDLVEQRRKADRDCRNGIQSAAPRGWFEAKNAMEDQGITDPASYRAAHPAPPTAFLAGIGHKTDREIDKLSPDELRRYAAALTDPAANAAWWNSLSDEEKAKLTKYAPELIGALDGLPPRARVQANDGIARELVAADRAEATAIREWLKNQTFDDSYGEEPGKVARLAELDKRIEYLRHAFEPKDDGSYTQFYLLDPGNDRLIEMFGDPSSAKTVMSFMPGTTASFEYFQQGKAQDLANWQVKNAEPPGSVLAFAFKDGTFPQLTDGFDKMPSNSNIASTIGANYARFHAGLDATAIGNLPVTSVEHSFASAAGGVAESVGANFTNRVILSGIGMNNGWEPNTNTNYLASAGENDLNKVFYGVHYPFLSVVPYVGGIPFEDLGYGQRPDESTPGIHVKDSGIETPTWIEAGLDPKINGTAGAAAPLWNALAGIAAPISAYNNHGRIITSNDDNAVVRDGLRDLLRDTR